MKLGVSEAGILRDFLRGNTSLKALYLYGNKFGVEGARLLAEGLA